MLSLEEIKKLESDFSELIDMVRDCIGEKCESCNKSYDKGKEDGYSEGYDEGDVKGYDEGYKKGHQDGSTEGYQKGYGEGFNDGTSNITMGELFGDKTTQT